MDTSTTSAPARPRREVGRPHRFKDHDEDAFRKRPGVPSKEKANQARPTKYKKYTKAPQNPGTARGRPHAAILAHRQVLHRQNNLELISFDFIMTLYGTGHPSGHFWQIGIGILALAYWPIAISQS